MSRPAETPVEGAGSGSPNDLKGGPGAGPGSPAPHAAPHRPGAGSGAGRSKAASSGEGRAPRTPSIATPRQPLNGWAYVGIAGVAALIGLAILAGYVAVADRLGNVARPVYFVVLVCWGLVAALLLFGAMRGVATLVHRTPAGPVTLGGPAALFAVVVFGGLWASPPPRTDQDLTIRVEGPGGESLQVGPRDSLRVAVGTRFEQRPFDDRGEVHLGDLPTASRDSLSVTPLVVGFARRPKAFRIPPSRVLTVTLEPDTGTVELTGTVQPATLAGRTLRILVDGREGESIPDATTGRFRLRVRGRAADVVTVIAYADTAIVYRGDHSLDKAAWIQLTSTSTPER